MRKHTRGGQGSCEAIGTAPGSRNTGVATEWNTAIALQACQLSHKYSRELARTLFARERRDVAFQHSPRNWCRHLQGHGV